ncbi:MAG: hypothetical protein ABIA83_00275, partial [Patescibacteria group bacterium]
GVKGITFSNNIQPGEYSKGGGIDDILYILTAPPGSTATATATRPTSTGTVRSASSTSTGMTTTGTRTADFWPSASFYHSPLILWGVSL